MSLFIPVEECPSGCGFGFCIKTQFERICEINNATIRICSDGENFAGCSNITWNGDSILTRYSSATSDDDVSLTFLSRFAGLITYFVIAWVMSGAIMYFISRNATVNDLQAQKQGVKKDSSKMLWGLICISCTIIPVVSLICTIPGMFAGKRAGEKRFKASGQGMFTPMQYPSQMHSATPPASFQVQAYQAQPYQAQPYQAQPYQAQQAKLEP